MIVTCRIFRDKGIESWEALGQRAAAFATTVGRPDLISVSHSSNSRGPDTIIVWYWANAER